MLITAVVGTAFYVLRLKKRRASSQRPSEEPKPAFFNAGGRSHDKDGPPASAFFNAGGRSSYKDGDSPAFECSIYKDSQDGDVPKGDII